MTGATTQVCDELLPSKATSSLHQHQMGTDTERGQSLALGTCRLALVADYQRQDRMASRRAGVAGSTNSGPNNCAGFARRLPHSHWLPSSLAADRRAHQITLLLGCVRHNSPARAVTGSAGGFPFAIGSGSRPAVGNTLADQQSVNAFADLPHLSINLSKASLRPTHIGRSEKEWRYLISVMRCPK